jgi:hypothetical protein
MISKASSILKTSIWTRNVSFNIDLEVLNFYIEVARIYMIFNHKFQSLNSPLATPKQSPFTEDKSMQSWLNTSTCMFPPPVPILAHSASATKLAALDVFGFRCILSGMSGCTGKHVQAEGAVLDFKLTHHLRVALRIGCGISKVGSPYICKKCNSSASGITLH